jgi:hypothetical protein
VPNHRAIATRRISLFLICVLKLELNSLTDPFSTRFPKNEETDREAK